MTARPLGAVCWALVLAALAAHSAQAVDLRFRPRVGEERKYALLISGRVVSSGPESEDSAAGSRREGSVRLHYALKALSETEEQTLVEVRQLDGEATLSAGGETATVELPPFRSVFRFDRRREAETEEEEGGDPPDPENMPDEVCGLLGDLEVGCGMWTEVADCLYLPKDPVEVGATWSFEGKMGDTAHTTEFRLEELTERAGHKCAKIRAKWRTPYAITDLPADLPEEAQADADWLRMEGLTTGEVVVYYDYENSLDVYAEGTVGSESKPKAAESSSKMLLNFKITLVE